jgi:hypothetical protein
MYKEYVGRSVIIVCTLPPETERREGGERDKMPGITMPGQPILLSFLSFLFRQLVSTGTYKYSDCSGGEGERKGSEREDPKVRDLYTDI